MINLKWKCVIHTPEGDTRTVAAFDIASEAIRYAKEYTNVWKCTHMNVISTGLSHIKDDVIHIEQRTKPIETIKEVYFD